MTTLTTDFDVRYGAHRFSVLAETTAISGTPVEDAAQRTIAYWVWNITLKDYIQSDSGSGTAVRDALQELTKPAQAFYYVGVGFKDLRINVTGQRDVIWGPKPRVISIKPFGGNAVRIEWSVQVALAEFGDNTAFGRPLMFNYSLATAVSRAGISRRTYTASLQIPLTRSNANNRELPDHADRFLEEINPPLIPGFRRGERQRTLDDAKTKLTYTLVDEELPSTNVPPPGCVDATAEHSIETDNFAMLNWTGSITASYELVKGLTKKIAVQYFTNLARDRMKAAEQFSESLAVIPTKLAIRESNLYGAPTVHFALNYRYTTTLKNLLEAHGMFRPVPDSDWQKWATSLEKSAFAPRGLAGLKFEGAHDAIVDLGAPQERLPKPIVRKTGAEQLGGKLADVFGTPTKDESWVSYRNQLLIEHQDEVSVLKKLPAAALQVSGAAVSPFAGAVTGYVLPYVGQAAGVVVQKRAEPTMVVVMVGSAVRAGFEIPAPHLVTVGGAVATPANTHGCGFQSGVCGNWGGVSLIKATWRLRYVISGRPGLVQAPPNPMVSEGKVA